MPDIAIKTPDGAAFSAYMALPVTTPTPAIIVIQEIFGVNADMRAKCDAFAAEGYVAIAPDLFWRQEPNIQLTDQTEGEWQKARTLLKGFNIDKGIEDLKTTLDFLRAHPACDKKVGCVGFCLGGKLAYLMACRSLVDAAVGYYGVDLGRFMGEASTIKNPCLMHIAEEDEYVNRDEQEKIKTALKNNPHVTIHSYPGMQHAFSRKNGKHYNAEATILANSRTTEFFTSHLNLHHRAP